MSLTWNSDAALIAHWVIPADDGNSGSVVLNWTHAIDGSNFSFYEIYCGTTVSDVTNQCSTICGVINNGTAGFENTLGSQSTLTVTVPNAAGGNSKINCIYGQDKIWGVFGKDSGGNYSSCLLTEQVSYSGRVTNVTQLTTATNTGVQGDIEVAYLITDAANCNVWLEFKNENNMWMPCTYVTAATGDLTNIDGSVTTTTMYYKLYWKSIDLDYPTATEITDMNVRIAYRI